MTLHERYERLKRLRDDCCSGSKQWIAHKTDGEDDSWGIGESDGDCSIAQMMWRTDAQFIVAAANDALPLIKALMAEVGRLKELASA